MSVTLLDVWRAARVRSVPFSGESAGYLVLALWEETRGTRAVELGSVELTSDGGVRLVEGSSCAEALGEKQLRALLGRLLEVASSPGPSLWRAAGRSGSGGASGLGAELRKALIPFNRAAARRALLRLFRETERALADGRLGEPPDQGSEHDLLRLSPPPAKVSELLEVAPPATVVREQAEPSPRPAKVEAIDDLAQAQVITETQRIQVSQPPAIAEPRPLLDVGSSETEHLTRPETVVSRRRARISAPPPPLPPSERAAPSRTPRMGSMDVAVVAVEPEKRRATPTPSPPPLPVADLTERAPEVAELLDDEVLEESPALVVGVHVADSEEVAEPVNDEEIETRPLKVLAPPMPYEGVTTPPTDVGELVRGFQVAPGVAEKELRRELKALAGVDQTPGAAVDVLPR